MTTRWTKWLVAASAMAALSLGFVSQSKADEYLKTEKGYGPLPASVRSASNTQSSGYNTRYRTRVIYRPVFVQPVYYGYYPYGPYSPYNVPSQGWHRIPPPLSYDYFGY